MKEIGSIFIYMYFRALNPFLIPLKNPFTYLRTHILLYPQFVNFTPFFFLSSHFQEMQVVCWLLRAVVIKTISSNKREKLHRSLLHEFLSLFLSLVTR